VWILNTRAEPVLVLRGPEGASTTNVAFGGVNRQRLFVTDSSHGDVLYADLEVPGLALRPI
jgi:gluconolactonase